MSLALVATGYGKPVRIGYRTFSLMRLYIAKAYSEKHGELYDYVVSFQKHIDGDEFIRRWNEGCNDDLDILLWHSDCDGNFSANDCKRLYRVLSSMDIFFPTLELVGVYNAFMDILKHCAKRRVKMRFC